MSTAAIKFIETQAQAAELQGLSAAAAFYTEALAAMRAIEKVERQRATPRPVEVSGLGGGRAWLVGPPPAWLPTFVEAVEAMPEAK